MGSDCRNYYLSFSRPLRKRQNFSYRRGLYLNNCNRRHYFAFLFSLHQRGTLGLRDFLQFLWIFVFTVYILKNLLLSEKIYKTQTNKKEQYELKYCSLKNLNFILRPRNLLRPLRLPRLRRIPRRLRPRIQNRRRDC